MPDVIEAVRANPKTSQVRLTMTDLYPNPEAVARFNRDGESHLSYAPDAVDATDLAHTPAGLKTMVNCFHHMRPQQARAILASAQRSRQPLLIYEMGDNKIPFALWVVALPISLPIVFITCLVLTPMVRPLTFRQLFFTYLVPVIPAFYAWDGQASMPRIYTSEDLDELIEALPAGGYRWTKGPALSDSGRALGHYLLGLPEANKPAA